MHHNKPDCCSLCPVRLPTFIYFLQLGVRKKPEKLHPAEISMSMPKHELRSRAVIHCTLCVCQCVEHPQYALKYHPNACTSHLYDERDYIICAFSFIPYLVCRCTLGFGMLSALSLMFWWCFAAESWGDSSLPCVVLSMVLLLVNEI